MKLIDLRGRRFGRLVVVARELRPGPDTMWQCRCDCGRDRVVNSSYLRRGSIISCGCPDPALREGRRPWPRDPRYLVGEDGSIVGPRGRELRPTMNDKGYPVIGTRWGNHGQVHEVHTVVCETFHGPRPPGHEAAHENGIATDCRPANLSWKTPAQNSADRVRHGTQTRGETHGMHKLTEDEVRAIRAATRGGQDLAARYGVCYATVKNVRARRTWAHLP